MEKDTTPEQEPQVYYLAARFHTREEAEVPYFAVQAIVLGNKVDLSAFRFMPLWERAEKPWLVVVIGEKPTDAIHQQLSLALVRGEMASLSEETIDFLLLRRIQMSLEGPKVEGHYKEGLPIRFSRRPKGKGHRRRRH